MLNYFVYYLLYCLIIDYSAKMLAITSIDLKRKIMSFVVMLVSLIIVSKISFNGAGIYLVILKTLVILLIQLYYFKHVYKANLKENIIFNLLALSIAYISINIADNLYTDLIIRMNFNGYYAYLTIILISNIITLMIWFILTRIIKEFKNFDMTITMFPVIIMAITIFIILMMAKYDLSNSMIISSMVVIVLLNYIAIYLYIKFINTIKTNIEKHNLEMEIKYYKEKARLELSHYNTSFNFVHNMIYRIKKAEEDASNNDIKAVQEELYDIHRNLLKEFNIIYSNSEILSSIINSHLSEITKENIDFKTTIKYSDFTFMSEIDLTKLFELLITAAIESCKHSKQENKMINIISSLKSSFLVINIAFTNDDYSIIETVDSLNKIIKKYNGYTITNVNKELNYNSIDIAFNLEDIKQFKALENI